MSTYNPDALAELQEKFDTIIDRRNNLFALIYPTELNQPKARNYLEQGVMRRISLIAQSVVHVFRLIPPDTTAIPSKETIDQATIHLHANYINLYGFMDCWAHVWASEYALDETGNPALKNSRIGIGSSYEEFRGYLNQSLVDYLREREEWITLVALLRHSLAHRVPPYIPPHMVDPSNEEPYRDLQARWFNSLDTEERERLNSEMESISHFKAFLVYDLDESPPIAFHAQLVSDFLTVEEFSQRFVFAIQEMAKHA